MSWLKNEHAHVKRQIELLREIDCLYDNIEWGGLAESEWTRLHELEAEIPIPGTPPMCFADYVKVTTKARKESTDGG